MKILNLLIYREAKRPVTKQLLQQINLHALSSQIKQEFITEKLLSFDPPIDEQQVINLYLKMRN